MDKLVENHLTIFQNYQSLNSLNPDDLVLVLDTILNIDRCSNQYFHEIRDHMIKYYHKEEDSVNELLNILEILTAICFNLVKTPWRNEFKKLRSFSGQLQHLKDFLDDDIVDRILKDIGFRFDAKNDIYEINSKSLVEVKTNANKVVEQIFEIYYYYQNILEIKSKLQKLGLKMIPTKIVEYLWDNPNLDCLQHEKILKEIQKGKNNIELRQKDADKTGENRQKDRNRLATVHAGYAVRENENNNFNKTYTQGQLNSDRNISRQYSGSNDSRRETTPKTDENGSKTKEVKNLASPPNPDQMNSLNFPHGQKNGNENGSKTMKEVKSLASPNPDQMNSLNFPHGQKNANENGNNKKQQTQCSNCNFLNNPDRFICALCLKVH